MLNVLTITSENKSTSITQGLDQQGIYDQLNQLFTEQNEEKKTVLEARAILGESSARLTDAQVYDLVNEIQFLVDSWLEEYERKVFDGKTLNELFHINRK